MQFIEIDPSFERSTFFSKESENSTWLVADLEHKTWFQNSLLEKESWLEEDRVLRANELWSKLLMRYHPDITIVSSMFVDSFIREWLPQQNINWARGDSSARF